MLHTLVPIVGVTIVGGVYTVKARLRLRSERTARLPRSPFVPKPVVELGYALLAAVGPWVARLGITANHCTAASMVVGLASAGCMATGHLLAGGGLLLFGSSFDTLDGIIARATHTASDAGEFFDATADRFNDAIAFLGLLWYYRADEIGFGLASLALVGSLLVSYTRAKGEALGVECSVGWMQRHERIIWLGVGLVAGPLAARRLEPGVADPRCHVLLAALAVIGLFSFATAVQRSWIVYRTLAPGRTRHP